MKTPSKSFKIFPLFEYKIYKSGWGRSKNIPENGPNHDFPHDEQ